jgi:putative effector of murein hydrolase LrgA (UPF0299 family)
MENIEKPNPSLFLEVITMYFIPAFLAIFTHCSASNEVGLNSAAYFSYSAMGMLAVFIIHSAWFLSPLYSPAGTAYNPQ